MKFAIVGLVLIFSFADCKAQFEMSFQRADSMASLFPKHSLKDLSALVSKLTTPLKSDEEKFRAIYRWICNNIDNDHELYLANKNKRERTRNAERLAAWNSDVSKLVFDHLINQYKTVCSGYAYLLREMSALAGLECVVINGYGRTTRTHVRALGIANHTWNAVKLHGIWRLSDVTWSSGATDAGAKKYIKRFDESYFLVDPSVFVRNHYPLDTTWLLTPRHWSRNEFVNGPLVYAGAYQLGLIKLSPETFDVSIREGDRLSFQFESTECRSIDNVELRINSVSPAFITHHPTLTKSTGNSYAFDHAFLTKGEYVVNVLLNNVYAFTYSVTVD